MHPITRSFRAVGARLKAAAQRVSLRWATTTASWTFTPSTWSAYGTATAPTPRANSICESVVAVIARTFPESPVHVLGPAAGGKTAPVADHPLGRLVASPNPYYGGEQLWRATLGDWYYDGNAYWYKKRNEDGRPIQLWWLPAWTVEPYSDDPEIFVQHYVYRVGGREQRIPPADLVHFRNGLDPQNPRRGRSPFASVLSEVFQDQEAARFGQALLANLGIPGVVIAPQQPPAPGIDARQKAEEVKQTFKERFGGDRRGDPLVLTTPTNVQVLSFSPDQMDLTALRRVPEERISAVVGVSAMVVGLGVGYEHSIYNNYDVAYQALYETNLIPTQRLFAGELQVQLLPELGDERRQRVAFDNSAVRVLQPDLDALWKRVGQGVNDAIITPNEAREAVGLKPLPGADVLYVKMTVTPTPSTELVPPEPEPEEPAPLEEPAALRALPPPKSRKAARRKASGPAAHAAALTRLRDQQQPGCEREMAAFLASQWARTAGKVRARGKAIGVDQVFDTEAEARRLNRVIRTWYERVLGLVHGGTQDALGVSFELDDALTRAYLAGAATQVASITETTRAAIAGALQAGQAEGEGLDALAKRVRALTEFSPARATVVARTELGMASQAAAVHAYRSSGLVTHVQVFDGTDDDDACRQANGQTWTLEQAANNPLQHPNCLVGGTLVLAPNLTASFTRWFDGEVVVLRTAANDLLTCTPNHPVLTNQGWVAAGAVRQGAYVIRCLDAQRVARLLDPDHDHVPARIEQVADALGPASGGTATAVPTAAEDFHGDGCREHVHVVRTKGHADPRRQAGSFPDPKGQPAVVVTHAEASPFAGGGAALQTLERVGVAATGDVRGGRVGRVGVPVTDLDADLLEAIPDRLISDAEGLSDPARRFAGLVAASEIVHVERKAFSGHVYNLETRQGWYIAGGIITHNCRRAFGAIVGAAGVGATGEGAA